MPALVSSQPHPVPLNSFASTASSSPRFPDNPRPPDDLLAETLVYDENGVAHTRDYTDDLEDLVSMSVAQQLHSRRSQSTMHTYLPQSPPPPPLHPRSSNGSLRSNYLSSSPSQSHSLFPHSPSEDALGRPVARSGIPRPGPGGGSKSRSPSPEVPRSASGNVVSKIPGPVQVARGKSSGGLGTEGGGGAGEEWETLQVGTRLQARSQSQPPNRKGSVASGHGPKPVNFPSSPTPANRPLATKSSNTQNPRKRAQTQQNLGSATAAGRNGSPSQRAGATSTPPHGTSSASRRPAANRTNMTTTPSTSARGKPRRKSISISREFSNASPSPSPSYDPDASSSSLPHWSTTRAPLVFRTSKGELGTSGRPEDLVLPAVARRLEAERLAKLGLQQKENDPWLFDEWGVDGTPRSMTVGVAGREGRNGSGTPTPNRGGERQDEVEGMATSTPPEQLNTPSQTLDHQTRLSSPCPEPDGPSSPSPHSLSVGVPSFRNSQHNKPTAIFLDDGPVQPVGEVQAMGEKSEKAASGKGGAKEKRQKSDADKAGCCACVIS
ncbi:hypothetical protein JCM1841_006538 [Sporobolomyces salmonicolor]